MNATVLGIGLASFFSDLSHETVTVLLPGLLASLGVAAAALGTIEGVADGEIAPSLERVIVAERAAAREHLVQGALRANAAVRARIEALERAVMAGRTAPATAARELLETFLGQRDGAGSLTA